VTRSDVPGQRLISLSWLGTALFVASAAAATISLDYFGWPAVIISLGLFGIGIVTMLWAFAIAVERSRVDAIGVGGLFFGAGSAPKPVRWHLLGALTLQIITGFATASVRPFTAVAFGTLVPIFAIGMTGLWVARYGKFEPTDAPGAPDEVD